LRPQGPHGIRRRKSVEAEQQKYELGRITAFEVLEAQSRFAAGERSLPGFYGGYQKSLISYERAVWTPARRLGDLCRDAQLDFAYSPRRPPQK
jgi:hypothetical protein